MQMLEEAEKRPPVGFLLLLPSLIEILDKNNLGKISETINSGTST